MGPKRIQTFRWLATVLLLAAALAGHQPAAAAPAVVVSLPPLHSLAAAVMGDRGRPHLLLRGGRSPHNAALRPSEIRRLRDASVVLWVGPTLEYFLTKPLAATRDGAAVITILDLPALKRFSRRSGGAWEAHDHEHEAPRGLSDAVIDPHVWLSPANAVVIARAVADTLTHQDPDNARAYRTNLANLIARIGALDDRLARSLVPVRDVPYLVFHDAYQYFERYFRLNAIGAVAISPERLPGARRLSDIRRRIEQAAVRCVFREPQFPPRLLETLIRGTGVRIRTLDPLGADIPPGPDLWFRLMSDLADGLTNCLGRGS